jgi:hypothetical protein
MRTGLSASPAPAPSCTNSFLTIGATADEAMRAAIVAGSMGGS